MINKALLVEHLKRFWAVPAISSLIYVLAVFLPLNNRSSWTANQLLGIISMEHPLVIFIAIITAVAAAFCVFGCFFNKTAVTAFYSMPLNKKQLFCTNAFAGIILSLIPVLFFSVLILFPTEYHEELRREHEMRNERILRGHSRYENEEVTEFAPQKRLPETLLPNGAKENARINSFPIVAEFFLRMTLLTIFYFAIAWLGFSVAGHGFVGVMIVAVIPFLPIGILMILELITQLYVFGISSLFEWFGSSKFDAFFVYHTPALWSAIIDNDDFTRTTAIFIPAIFYIVLSAAIFVGAYFISRLRKAERTGNSVVFIPVKNVCVFLVSCAGMMTVAAILYRNGDTLSLHIGMIFGFAIGFFIAQMIAEKTFHVLGKIKFLPKFFCVAAGMYISMIFITQFGIGFIVNRVPHENEIFGVYAHHNFPWGIDGKDWRDAAITDREFILATQNAHRSILQNKKGWWLPPGENMLGSYRYNPGIIGIKYILHNGKIVTRNYNLSHEFVDEYDIENFFRERNFILAPHFLLRNPEHVNSIELSIFYNVYDSELGRTISSHNEEIKIAGDRAQLDTLLKIITDGVVENRIQNREERRRQDEEQNRRDAFVAEPEFRWEAIDERPTMLTPVPISVERSTMLTPPISAERVWNDANRTNVNIRLDTGITGIPLYDNSYRENRNSSFWRWHRLNIEGEALDKLLAQLDEWDLLGKSHENFLEEHLESFYSN